MTIVRPHEEALQRGVIEVLRQAGVLATGDDVLPSELSDDEVVAEVRRRRAGLLVIPFRQPGSAVGRASGVDLLQRLEVEAPDAARVPVLMPVTVFAAGKVRMMLGEANPDETLSRATRHRILVVHEDQLDDPKLPELVRMHLRLHASRMQAV